MPRAAKQSLAMPQGGFNFVISGKMPQVTQPAAFGRFLLGQAEIADTLLADDARRLLGHTLALVSEVTSAHAAEPGASPTDRGYIESNRKVQ